MSRFLLAIKDNESCATVSTMEMDTPTPRDRPVPALNDTQSSQSACNRCVQMNIWDTVCYMPVQACDDR